jgi:aryl-alcohol dehydrogenase-like predicted oxidoreductase
MARKTFRNIFPADMIPLGFGCGALMDKLGPTESLRLLEIALDTGITYFDTARMYGYGRAEGILGKLMPRHRKRVILASKAGIIPPNRSIPRRLASHGIRLLQRGMPKLKDFVRAPEVWQPRFGMFEVADLAKSLETSLKELRTDYLDIFLLHECTAADIASPRLLEFLQNLKQQGKVRAFGIATGIEETIDILERHSAVAPVLQIPNSFWDMNIRRLPRGPNVLTITHSCLTNRLPSLMAQFASNDLLAKQWNTKTHIDPRDANSVAQLLLAHALASNPDGIVLFSSTSPKNIRRNARVALGGIVSSAQIDGLNALANELNCSSGYHDAPR